ncbi:MAG: homoserine O-acetyltransferase [Planctomycetota bacterium]|nr:MAG: homoserine O-acetyltransferase [Planctomycetota bacterium]
MDKNAFSGADETMGCGPLKHVRQAELPGPLQLEAGGELPEVTVAYETYGQLAPARDNVVLICHALTGDSHVAAHDDQDEPGWWDIVVGPGKAIDTDKFFVICPNVLGGCRGTTGPDCTNPATGKAWGQDFPDITVGDMVEVQKRLLEHLGIDELLAVIGGSMGGHQVLAWATKYPQIPRGLVALATSPRLSAQSLAFDVVGRNAIRQDPDFAGGQYYSSGAQPVAGLAIARMLGHITYLSPQAMSEKFEADRNSPRDVATPFEKDFSVGSYLAYKGQKFTQRFDANSYLTLSMAMDRFDLGGAEDLARAFAQTRGRWLVVSYSSDWLFPPSQSSQIVSGLIRNDKPVSYCNVASQCGHDAFLVEDDLGSYGELIRAFLQNILSGEMAVEDKRTGHSPTSIFHHARRLDYELIAELIPAGKSVLDLGCGRGGLLDLLRQRGQALLRGVEISEENILACVRRGLDVLHEDLNAGLGWFGDNQFDVVVLSRTLQAIVDIERVMDEMLRVGRQCIVSVPNFAYHKLRDSFAKTGRAPTAGLLHYNWYDTPNIRILTLDDFAEFCQVKGITVHKVVALDTEANAQISPENNPNRNADMAIFVLSRDAD